MGPRAETNIVPAHAEFNRVCENLALHHAVLRITARWGTGSNP